MLSFPSSYSPRMLEATLSRRGTLTEWGLGPSTSLSPFTSLVSPLLFYHRPCCHSSNEVTTSSVVSFSHHFTFPRPHCSFAQCCCFNWICKYNIIMSLTFDSEHQEIECVSVSRVRTHPSPGAALCLAVPGLCKREKLVPSVAWRWPGAMQGITLVCSVPGLSPSPHTTLLPVTCKVYSQCTTQLNRICILSEQEFPSIHNCI